MYDDTIPTEGERYISPEEEKLFDEIRDEFFDKVNDNLYIRKDQKEIEDPNEALYQLINTNGSSYEKYLELIERINNINYQNKLFNCGFFHVAIQSERNDIIRDLLKRGIDLNLQDKKGNTALIYLISHEQWELFREVLEMEPDVNIKNNVGNTLLWKTVSEIGRADDRRIHYDCVRKLLRMGSDPHCANICGVTPLQMVVDGGDDILKDIFKEYIEVRK